jgi:hypothetical protein
LLSSKLGGGILALGSLDGQGHDLELKFEDLVLDLAALKSGTGGGILATGSLDGLVETTSLGLSSLSSFAGGLENGKILGADGCGVLEVDLRMV